MDSNDNPLAEGNATSVTAIEPEPPQPRRTIAPVWHTVVLIVVFIVVSVGGANSQETMAERGGRLPLYGMTIAFEWLMVVYVWWGVRKRKVSLRELTGGRWAAPEDALLDVAIGIGFWMVAMGILAATALAIAAATGQMGGGAATHAARLAERCAELKKTVGFLAPATGTEILVFLGLGATAGFCEEIIFRGYFQRQFAALSGMTAVGVIAQAILFGASHGYQGVSRMALIALYGAMFGVLATVRKSLRPGMIAHAMHDDIMGLLMRPLMRVMNC